MARQIETHQRLLIAVEVAVREFQAAAEDLREIVDLLPRRSRSQRLYLESIAGRLDGAAAVLGSELMREPNLGFIRSILGSARKAVAPIAIGVAVVATGAGEEMGSDLYRRVKAASMQIETTVSAAELEIDAIALDWPSAEVGSRDPLSSHDLDGEIQPVGPRGYSGTQVAQIIGISYRQLDYWVRTDLVQPSLDDDNGGDRRRYSYSDLLELKAVKKLLDAGIKLEQVRNVFEYLRERGTEDVADAHIVVDGSSVMLVDGGELIDVLQNGQGALNVLSLSGVRNELERDLQPQSESS